MVIKYPWLLTKCVGDNVGELVQFLEFIKVLPRTSCSQTDLELNFYNKKSRYSTEENQFLSL